jgi:tRNA A-37 threonylcarbamoyl transferase component Bud32
MSAAHPWVRCRAGEFLWWVNREFFTPELVRALTEPQRLMSPPAERIVRSDGLARVTELVRTRLPELPGRGLIIKRYEPRDRWQSIKDLVRCSRAQRTFSYAFSLQKAGIATPTPIAVGERRCCRWVRESFLISEEIPGARTSWEHRKDSRSGRRSVLARALGRALGRLHDAGFSHSDPNFSNFLVRGGLSARTELVAIDLDGIRRKGFISPRTAAKDLYRLVRYMDPDERLWFVAQYCRSRETKLDPREFDALCQRYIGSKGPSDGTARISSTTEKVC